MFFAHGRGTNARHDGAGKCPLIVRAERARSVTPKTWPDPTARLHHTQTGGSKRNHDSASGGGERRLRGDQNQPQGGRSQAKRPTTGHRPVPVLSRSAKTSFPGRKGHSAALRGPFPPKTKRTTPGRAAPRPPAGPCSGLAWAATGPPKPSRCAVRPVVGGAAAEIGRAH